MFDFYKEGVRTAVLNRLHEMVSGYNGPHMANKVVICLNSVLLPTAYRIGNYFESSKHEILMKVIEVRVALKGKIPQEESDVLVVKALMANYELNIKELVEVVSKKGVSP